MNTKYMMRCLILAVSIALGGIVPAAPSRAFSFAQSDTALTLDSFSQQPENLATDINTNTRTVSEPGTSFATAIAQADATATITSFTQFSIANASGDGPNYFGRADARSTTRGTVATDGLFQFNFAARLSALSAKRNSEGTATALNPGETSRATSSVGFAIFDDRDLTTPIDIFQLNAIASNQQRSFGGVLSPFVTLNSFLLLTGGTGFEVEGTYSRNFGQAVNLLLEGTTTSSAVAQVPEPPVTVAMLVVPALIVWKRMRRAKQARLLRSCVR